MDLTAITRKDIMDAANFSDYINGIIDAARAAYLSGDTHAKMTGQMSEFIDGREDKTRRWTRI